MLTVTKAVPSSMAREEEDGSCYKASKVATVGGLGEKGFEWEAEYYKNAPFSWGKKHELTVK